MQILDPKVEYWNQGNTELSIKEHVSKCSQTAYRSTPKTGEVAEKFYNALVNSGHVSCLRHESRYFIVNYNDDNASGELKEYIYNFLVGSNPYIEIRGNFENGIFYVATNGNFLLDQLPFYDEIKLFEVDQDTFKATKIGRLMMRYTLYLTTSIDITREYNRRSPNNITEESTIFCNYSKDKFGGEIVIGGSKAFEPVADSQYIDILSDIAAGNSLDVYSNDALYDAAFHASEAIYMELTKNRNIKSEAARKVLPLGTKSGVVYTYSVKEWSHILRLRYLNTTGRDHFDANRLGSLIYEKMQELGYTLNEQGELV